MSNWYPEFENEIFQKLKGTKDRDLRFFRIEEFLRICQRVDSYDASCRECNSYKYEIEKQKESIATAVNTPGKERRSFDHLLSKMSRHMKKGHGFYPPYYFMYLYSVMWAAPLVILSLLVSLLFPTITTWAFLAPAFAIGIVSGQIYGGKKDKHIREQNKLL